VLDSSTVSSVSVGQPEQGDADGPDTDRHTLLNARGPYQGRTSGRRSWWKNVILKRSATRLVEDRHTRG
jgi:hypothetical protein